MLISGMAEELGTSRACFIVKLDGEKQQIPTPNDDHTDAVRRVFDELETRGLKESVQAIGHRVVHGAEQFTGSVIITEDVIKAVEAATPYAPLHNPPNIIGIRAAQKVMPDLPQVAVFDTAFHQTLPDYAYRYGVPNAWYSEHGVRRYGFHGTSYRFVAQAAAKKLGLELEDSAFVIAHLGSGASVAAVLNGQSADTSMGFTPLEGLVMATRSGDVDPAVVPFMMKTLDKSADEILDILNKESGLLGLAEFSSDTRDLEVAMTAGDTRAKLALEVFAFRVAKYLAAMMVSLPRVDAIIFTAGIGENMAITRQLIMQHLTVFGYRLDPKLNAKMIGREGIEGVISAADTPTVLTIKTNEELMIALDTAKLVQNLIQ